MKLTKVCIIGCGKGKRLNPLTLSIPKILVNINNENIITKIINYWKKYTNNFLIVVEKKYNNWLRFYLDTMDINYELRNVKINNQENSYTIKKSMYDQIGNEKIIITWCDILPNEDINIDLLNNDSIFVNNSKTYESRYFANNKILKKVKDYNEGNVVGIYYFKKYNGLLNDNDNQDLCDCILNTHSTLDTYELKELIDIGDKKKLYNFYKKQKYTTRYFNKITEINNKFLLKESVCNYGDKIISNEINFYKYIINNKINYPIPEIKNIKLNSFEIRRLENYTTLYDKLLVENDINRNKILKSLFKKLNEIYDEHNFEIKEEIYNRDLYKETIHKINNRRNNYEYIINNNIKYVNGIKIMSFDNLLDCLQLKISKLVKKINIYEYTLTHGDLNLSNIMINGNDFKFIDPRGYYGYSKIFGMKYYELCKIYFSILGFDKLNKNKNYYFEIKNNNILTNLDSIFDIEPILKEFYSKDEVDLIICLGISIWLGLPYYFKTNISKLIGSHYHALYLGTKYFRKYNLTILKTNVKDLEVFNELKKNKKYTLCKQPHTYKDLIINKPWGFEFLCFEYKYVSGWILHIKNNQNTSLHCHETKDTPMFLLQGKMEIIGLEENIMMNPGDVCCLNKKKFHQLKSHSDDTIVLELEIIPNKSDLFRYKDSYNRQNNGYEGLNKMITRNDDYFDYEEANPNVFIKDFSKLKLKFSNKKFSNLKYHNIYVIIRGCVQKNKVYLSEGSILYGYELINQDLIYRNNDFSYFEIHR